MTHNTISLQDRVHGEGESSHSSFLGERTSMPKWFVSIHVCVYQFFMCVCVCEEQLSGVASASIGSNVIYGNKCIRSLLSIHLSFSKKEQRIQRVLQQLSYLSKQCCDKWIQASIGEKTSFNLISWLSKVMFHYTVWSWLIMLSSEAQQVTRIVTSGSQRSLNSMRKVSFVLEDFAKTSSERRLFTSWGSTKSRSINV